MSRPTRVLVTGVGGPAGSSLASQLIERGLAVVGVDMEPVSAAFPTAQVPAAVEASFPEALAAVAARSGAGLLIPTVSEELPRLAQGVPGVTTVVSCPWAVATADDKWLTSLRLRAAGVPVPLSALPSDLRESRPWAFEPPWVSKPRVGRGGRGVMIHRASFGLARLDDSELVQELACGTEYAVNLFLAHDPRRDAVVTLEKLSLAQGTVGNGLAVRRVAAPDVGELARRAGRALGLEGPLDVDVRRRADGAPLVLEVNARFGAHSAHAPEVLDALLHEQRAAETVAA